MQQLKITIAPTVEDAPNWNTNGENRLSVKLTEAIVVRGGMENGLDTVDLLIEDEHGNKRVAMITGTLLKMLAAVVNPGSGLI